MNFTGEDSFPRMVQIEKLSFQSGLSCEEKMLVVIVREGIKQLTQPVIASRNLMENFHYQEKSYVIESPKLLLHTQVNNVVYLLKQLKVRKEKLIQSISEIVSGKLAGDLVGNLSKWERDIRCHWSNGANKAELKLFDWSFSDNSGEVLSFKGRGATGTSWRRIPNSKESSSLMNVYHTHVNDRHTIIRSGIIETPEKAAQYKEVVKAVLKERLSMKLSTERVASLSLISTFSFSNSEKEMVKCQHELLSAIFGSHSQFSLPKKTGFFSWAAGQKRSCSSLTKISCDAFEETNFRSCDSFFNVSELKKPSFLHMNYQTNLYEISGISVGEASSRRLNHAALVQLCHWALQDLKECLTFSVFQDMKAELLKRTEHALCNLSNGTADKKLLASMRAISFYYEKCFRKFLNSTNENVRQQVTALLKVSIALKTLCRLLQAHVEVGSVSRVCELLLISVLHVTLDFIFCVNCKSGCDRTGLMFAIASSVGMMWETRPTERIEFCDMLISFDEISQQQEKIYLKGPKQWGLYLDAGILEDPQAHKALLLCELKNIIFLNLMEVGWKCILYSTGLPGFKVGSENSTFKNPHVTPLLPPFIRSRDGSLMDSVEFRDFFIGASAYRGGN
ncbi:uncharacterized protein LOC135146342 isoform X2 [Zophobas morio]|uniref:uncharacterized protein LOC135146342 isoform X2 n=1 Tax=Zophobas morio TaxID=2755281 RepID=UPI0030839948